MNAVTETATDAGAFVRMDDISVTFPVKAGAFAKEFVHAVQHASLVVDPGQVLGIVGESGCGKSTLARVLIGLQVPQAGTLSIEGENVYALRVQERHALIARNLAMVFQDPASSLNPRLSAERIIRDPLDVHGIGEAASRRARVEELMALVGLPESIGPRLPREMSGGQRQRVAIARALALRAAYHRRRRAHLGTRCLGALADHQPARRSEATARARHGVHLARHSYGALPVRSPGGHVSRPRRGAGHDEPAVADDPRHPYTQALLSASLSVGDAERERITLSPGNVPSPRRPPPGCPFPHALLAGHGTLPRDSPGADPGGEAAVHLSHPLSLD